MDRVFGYGGEKKEPQLASGVKMCAQCTLSRVPPPRAPENRTLNLKNIEVPLRYRSLMPLNHTAGATFFC